MSVHKLTLYFRSSVFHYRHMTSLIACSQQAEYFFCLIGMHWRIYNEKNVYRAKISELEPCGFYRKEHQAQLHRRSSG